MREYSTDNLYLSAALVTAGVKFIKPRRNGTGRILFIFEDDGSIEELEQEFYSGRLCQPVNTYANSWKDLRRLIGNMK
jgi:hypothetical protein